MLIDGLCGEGYEEAKEERSLPGQPGGRQGS